MVELFAEHTADVWYEQHRGGAARPPGTTCAKCGGAEFRKETDILDVWFDSGSSHLAVLNAEQRPALAVRTCTSKAATSIAAGSTARCWWASGCKGGSPYRAVRHATAGRSTARAAPCRKSLGNVIEPDKIIKQYGAEMLRLWVASVEFTEDVRISETILARLSEAYRKLRNTFRYALGNLDDFDPAHGRRPGRRDARDRPVDPAARRATWCKQCRAWYDELRVPQGLPRASTISPPSDLSAIYFDVLKDRLYTAAPKSRARRSAQTALYRLTYALVRLLAPILTFTTEEVWTHVRHRPARQSVHLAISRRGLELAGESAGDGLETGTAILGRSETTC